MKPGLLLALALALAVAVADAGAATKPSYGPRPAWVVPLDPAVPTVGDDLGGVECLLADDQVRVGDDGAEQWTRRVMRVTSTQGVDSASRLQLDWDPSYETLTIHRVSVRRGDQVIERLDPAAIDVVRREPAFEASLLDGTLSALVLVPDVRVGDVVEDEFTIAGRNPVFDNRWFGGFSADVGVDARRVGFRVLWPRSRTLRWQIEGDAPDPEVAIVGSEREASWLLDDPVIPEYEGDEPSWFDPSAGASISEFASWAEVARWAAPLYRVPEPSPALSELVARIRDAQPTPEARALEAIRFVQDDVRYLGLEIGTGSHRPTDPSVVLDRRFGDCKDKALLLVTLLRGLGIEADCALVSTTWLDELSQRLPSPGDFDHVIVRLTLDGQATWIDPTVNAQRGRLAVRHAPELGAALVVRDDTDGLVEVEPSPGDDSRTEVEARFSLAKVGEPGSMSVTTTYRGLDADDVRASLQDESREQTERTYREYYARAYPGAEPMRKLVIRDDENDDVIMTEESYRLPAAWERSEDGTSWTATLRTPEIEGLLGEPEVGERESPLAIDHPQHVVHHVVIDLPADWHVDEQDLRLRSAGATFTRSVRNRQHGLEIRTEWKTLADWIAARDAAQHVTLLRRAADATTLRLSADADGRPVSDGAKSMGLNWSALAIAFVTALLGVAIVSALLAVPRREFPPEAMVAPPHGFAAAAILAVLATTLALAGLLAVSLAPFGLARWVALTVPGSASFRALAAPLLLASLVGNVLLLTLALGLFALLLARRRTFFLTAALVTVGSLGICLLRIISGAILPDVFSALASTLAAVALLFATATLVALSLSTRFRGMFWR